MWFPVQKASMEWLSDAPAVLHNEIVLPTSTEEAFDVLADPEQWPRWFPEFRDARWSSDRKREVGSRRVVHLNFISAREEFLVWEPGERFAFAILEMTLPLVDWLVEDYRLEALPGDRCRLAWDVYYQPRWFLRPLNPLVSPIVDWVFANAIEQLADYLAPK